MRPPWNLYALRADMEKQGWVIDNFKFHFKRLTTLFWLFCILDQPWPQCALVQQDFLDIRNFEYYLLVSANAGRLMIHIKQS